MIGSPLLLFMTIQETNFLESELFIKDPLFWSCYPFIGSVGILLMLPVIETLTIQNKFIHGFFTMTSKLSYTMYLLHIALLKIVLVICGSMQLQRSEWTYLSIIAIYLLLLYVFSSMNYQFLEKRFMRYRTLFVKKYFKD